MPNAPTIHQDELIEAINSILKHAGMNACWVHRIEIEDREVRVKHVVPPDGYKSRGDDDFPPGQPDPESDDEFAEITAWTTIWVVDGDVAEGIAEAVARGVEAGQAAGGGGK